MRRSPADRRPAASPGRDLFDPARLRERWERSARGAPRDAPRQPGKGGTPPAPAPVALLERLEAALAARLSPADRAAVAPLLAALAEPLAELASPTLAPARRRAVASTLRQQLAALEDVLEALLLASGTSP